MRGGWNVCSIALARLRDHDKMQSEQQATSPTDTTAFCEAARTALLKVRCGPVQYCLNNTRCVRLLRLLGRLPKRFATILGKRL